MPYAHDDNYQLAFDQQPVIKNINFNQPFSSQTDVCDVGAEEVLLQKLHGFFHPVRAHPVDFINHQWNFITVEVVKKQDYIPGAATMNVCRPSCSIMVNQRLMSCHQRPTMPKFYFSHRHQRHQLI